MSEIQIIDIIDESKSDLKALTALILGLAFLSKELVIQDEELFYLSDSLERVYQKLESIEFDTRNYNGKINPTPRE